MKKRTRIALAAPCLLAAFILTCASQVAAQAPLCNSNDQRVGYLVGSTITDMTENPLYEIVRIPGGGVFRSRASDGSPIVLPSGNHSQPSYEIHDMAGGVVGTATYYGGEWKFFDHQRRLVMRTCY